MAKYSYGPSGSTQIIQNVTVETSASSGGSISQGQGIYLEGQLSASVSRGTAIHGMTLLCPPGLQYGIQLASKHGATPTPYMAINTNQRLTEFSVYGIGMGSGAPIYMGSSYEVAFTYDEGATETVLVEVDGLNGRGMTFTSGSALYFGKGASYGEVEASIYTNGQYLQISGTNSGSLLLGDVTVGTACSQSFYLSSSLTASCDSLILSDKKIYFGTGHSASINYNGYFLQISGSPNGTAITGSIYAPHITAGYAPTSSFVGVNAQGKLVLTSSGGGGGGGTPGGSDTQIQFNDGGSFGAQSNLAYFKNQSTLFVSASQSIFSGSTIITGSAAVGEPPSYDGQGGDGIVLKVEGGGAYQQAGNPVLVCQVTGTQYSGDVGYVGIGTSQPLVPLDIRWNVNLDAASGYVAGGDVVNFATGSTDAGALYYLGTGGGWLSASAHATGSGNNQMLGIAVGTDAQNDGMLIRGWADVSGWYSGDFLSGQAVYIHSGTAGFMSGAAPTADNSYSRIVGYASPNPNTIYFNPGTTWVELTGSS